MIEDPDEFHDFLMAFDLEVERQGGARLPDPCAPQQVTINYKKTHPDGRPQKATTCGCGDEAVFVVPYEHETKNEPAYVRFCAYCDGADMWPRFQETMA